MGATSAGAWLWDLELGHSAGAGEGSIELTLAVSQALQHQCEKARAQFVRRGHGIFSTVMNWLPFEESVPDAHPSGAPPCSIQAHTPCPGSSKGCAGSAANLQTLCLFKTKVSRRDLSRGELVMKEPGLCPDPASLPQAALPRCSPQASQPGLQVTDCVTVAFCFFLLTLIIIVSPSIDTQTP